MTKHAKVEIAALFTLTLGSCQAPWESKLDIADVNARNALARCEQLTSRVEEIESRLGL